MAHLLGNPFFALWILLSGSCREVMEWKMRSHSGWGGRRYCHMVEFNPTWSMKSWWVLGPQGVSESGEPTFLGGRGGASGVTWAQGVNPGGWTHTLCVWQEEGVWDHTQAHMVAQSPHQGLWTRALCLVAVAEQLANEVCCLNCQKIVYGIKPAVCDKLISEMLSGGCSYLWKRCCGNRV